MVLQTARPLSLNQCTCLAEAAASVLRNTIAFSYQSMYFHPSLFETLLCSFHPQRRRNAFSLALVQESSTPSADLPEMLLGDPHLILIVDGSDLQTETGNDQANLSHSRSRITLRVRFVTAQVSELIAFLRACQPGRERVTSLTEGVPKKKES